VATGAAGGEDSRRLRRASRDARTWDGGFHGTVVAMAPLFASESEGWRGFDVRASFGVIESEVRGAVVAREGLFRSRGASGAGIAQVGAGAEG
jgi:hypothetical protein